jgi:hypothetical protein
MYFIILNKDIIIIIIIIIIIKHRWENLSAYLTFVLEDLSD